MAAGVVLLNCVNTFLHALKLGRETALQPTEHAQAIFVQLLVARGNFLFGAREYVLGMLVALVNDGVTMLSGGSGQFMLVQPRPELRFRLVPQPLASNAGVFQQALSGL